MSPSRSALLEMLRGQPEPTTQAALVRISGLHANTVREHLRALVGQGLVRRHLAEPAGRGRPAWLYECTGTNDSDASEYAALASVLAASLARHSSSPVEAGTRAGEDWGHELASDRGATPDSPEIARDQVLRLLDDLGFAPEPTADHSIPVRLTRCPLLEAAHREPEVVCGVHMGIVRGALAAYGGDPADSDLVAFAEPGACHLTLPARREDPQ